MIRAVYGAEDSEIHLLHLYVITTAKDVAVQVLLEYIFGEWGIAHVRQRSFSYGIGEGIGRHGDEVAVFLSADLLAALPVHEDELPFGRTQKAVYRSCYAEVFVVDTPFGAVDGVPEEDGVLAQVGEVSHLSFDADVFLTTNLFALVDEVVGHLCGQTQEGAFDL